MVDLKVLEKRNSTQQRLKEICTAMQPANYNDLEKEQQEKIDRDIEWRKKIEDRIQYRLWESIQFNLKNFQLFSAVDLAWDSTPINKAVFPLMLYAQGKFDMGQCASSLEKAGFGKYVAKDAKGSVTNIDIPKFYETQVNLIRSILTRRLAAQSNKYANLWPYYAYESRSTSLVGKLRADIMSQRADIISDQYDYRHHEVQVMRDMLFYCNSVDFIRCSWEKEEQEFFKEQAAGLETDNPDIEKRVIKEGLPWVNPHPSRVFWDNSYPLPSINSDTGCEWLGYWDVVRYRDIHGDTKYWNRDKVSYSSGMQGIFSNPYFTSSQYYCTIKPPVALPDYASQNDRANNVGTYASEQGDTSVIVSYFFWKIVPKDWGIGDYPYPVWCRFIIASDKSIQFAEFLPSSPAAVASYNANDNRQINISFAHELMGFQDQLTNLLTYLLLCLQADNIKVLIVDKEVADAEQIKAFREQLKGQSAYTGTTVLEISRTKLQELGITSAEQVIKLVETRGSQLDVIFRAIGQLLQMVERMAALSPQEQGQPAPREISATETNLIAGTTESVYGFISDAIDEYRAAKKRILYESYIALGEAEFRCPVMNRYPKSVIISAGFKAEDGEQEQAIASGQPRNQLYTPTQDRYTVIGSKSKLVHDYIFTSRDGAERAVNTQSANVLVQLLQSVVSLPPVLAAMKKDQLYGIVNEVFRLSGAGHDLKLDVEAGEENSPLGANPTEETLQKISQMIEGLTQAGEKNQGEIEQMKNAVAPLLQALSARGLQSLPAAA
jgi:hypothetical protein